MSVETDLFRTAEQGKDEHHDRDHFKPAYPHHDNKDPLGDDRHIGRDVTGINSAGGKCRYHFEDDLRDRITGELELEDKDRGDKDRDNREDDDEHVLCGLKLCGGPWDDASLDPERQEYLPTHVEPPEPPEEGPESKSDTVELDPASCASRSPADESKHREEEQGHAGPDVKIRCLESGGGEG